jgi:hypothetical protein
MKSARLRTKGFTLIASLLLLLLLSGIAIGLMMMVNTEGRVGGTDLQNNAAYHSAEGGIEKMTADLAATFQNALAPTDDGGSHLERLYGNARTGGADLPGHADNAVWTDQFWTEPGFVGANHPSEHAGDGGRTGRAGSEHDAERAGGADSGVPVWSVLGERSLILQRSQF